MRIQFQTLFLLILLFCSCSNNTSRVDDFIANWSQEDTDLLAGFCESEYIDRNIYCERADLNLGGFIDEMRKFSVGYSIGESRKLNGAENDYIYTIIERVPNDPKDFSFLKLEFEEKKIV